MTEHFNVSNPLWWLRAAWFRRFWRSKMCRRGYHLLSKKITVDATEHVLVCEACGLEIGVEWVKYGSV